MAADARWVSHYAPYGAAHGKPAARGGGHQGLLSRLGADAGHHLAKDPWLHAAPESAPRPDGPRGAPHGDPEDLPAGPPRRGHFLGAARLVGPQQHGGAAGPPRPLRAGACRAAHGGDGPLGQREDDAAGHPCHAQDGGPHGGVGARQRPGAPPRRVPEGQRLHPAGELPAADPHGGRDDVVPRRDGPAPRPPRGPAPRARRQRAESRGPPGGEGHPGGRPPARGLRPARPVQRGAQEAEHCRRHADEAGAGFRGRADERHRFVRQSPRHRGAEGAGGGGPCRGGHAAPAEGRGLAPLRPAVPAVRGPPRPRLRGPRPRSCGPRPLAAAPVS
ncbi:unnamed protein product, partial [Prorocentrum cordatum]